MKQRTLITILTWNRLNQTKETLKLLFKFNGTECDLLFFDNGSTDDTVSYLQDHHYKVIKSKKNIGIYGGTRELWLEAVKRKYDFILNLQNDFPCVEAIPFNNIYKFLGKNSDVGFVRLNYKKSRIRNRKKGDKKYRDGRRKNNVTGKKVKDWPFKKYGSTEICKTTYHFSFNPYLFKTSLVSKLVPDFPENAREFIVMERFEKTGLLGSRLGTPVFNTKASNHSVEGWQH